MSRPAQIVRRYPSMAFFSLAITSSWSIWAPLWLPALGVTGLPVVPFHHALGAIGPVAAAFIVAAVVEGAEGTRWLLASRGAWRGRLGWVAVAVLGPALVLGVAVVALVHATIDVVFTSDVASPPSATVTGILVTIWGLAVLGMAKPRTLAGRHDRGTNPALVAL